MSSGVSMELVKELRARTGIGIGKCKQALEETGGDMEEAIKALRKAGLASAGKKEGREAKEGQVVVGESDQAVAVVEVNAETDFVVKNEMFGEFGQGVAKQAAASQVASVEELSAQPWAGDQSLTIEEQRATVVQTLGENIQLRRLEIIKKSGDSSIGTYSHMGGKIVVVVELGGAADQGTLARDIAMHIAADAPEYISRDDVPAEILEREQEIAREQVKGKPPEIMDKIVDGKVRAYLDGICLLQQKYVKDPSITVAKLLANQGKELTVKRFIRWSVGEEA